MKKETKITRDNMIDVQGGELTYGQRIALGRILERTDMDDVDRYKAIIRALHPDWEVEFSVDTVSYALEIAKGIQFWVEIEAKRLKYTPTEEEIAARYDEVVKNVKELGVVSTLAEKFAKDPDIIYTWKYGKVFAMLYVDAERSRYARRLDKVRERKRKQAEKARAGRGRRH